MARQHNRGQLPPVRVLIIALLVVGLAGCTGTVPAPPPTAPPVAVIETPASQGLATVRAGVIGGPGEAGQYIAASQGYFAQEGIAVDFTRVDPSTVFTALITGGVDVAGLGVDPGVFSAVQRGVDLRIVATQVSSEPNSNGAFFVVRKDLLDSHKLQGYADMKGLTIGIPARGTSVEYLVARALEGGGLTMNDVKLVVLNFPDTLAALGTGAIDMGYLPEPLATIAVQNGSGLKWKGVSDIVPGFQIAAVVFSPTFAAQRDLATRWMTAYVRGIRDYNDAFVKNTHRAQTVEAIAGALSIKTPLFDSMGFAHIDPDGKLNVSSMEELTRWYVEVGYLTGSVDLSKAIDPSFAQAAVAKLGPYR